jgi:glycosyltransferase involved in cell wall biosynthesis
MQFEIFQDSTQMRQKTLLVGPAIDAVSGVSTHLNQLFDSKLTTRLELLHFQVGSEGRKERLAQKLFRFAFSPVAFFSFLLRHRPAIVHLNTSLEPKSYWRDIAYLLIARILKRKVVYQIHGGALPEDFFAGNRLLTGILRWVLKQPDVVVLLAEVELKAYRRFLPEQRLEVVPNAIETLVNESIADKSVAPIHLVYLGRIVENKGIFEVVETLSMLVKQGRDLRLTIAGNGPDEERLRARVNALGLSERVMFKGPVFGEDKDRLWRTGHIFAFPTYHREGLPYALLEAMAAGVVPITTRVGAIPDVMKDEVHGLLVKAKDVEDLARAIIRLDDDRELLGRMAESGQKRVIAHYTTARLADDFARIYDSLEMKE